MIRNIRQRRGVYAPPFNPVNEPSTKLENNLEQVLTAGFSSRLARHFCKRYATPAFDFAFGALPESKSK